VTAASAAAAALALLALAQADAGAPDGNAPDAGVRWMDLDEAARREALAALGPSLQERLLEVSRRFIDTPYRHSPLGEGDGGVPDPDPLIRFDLVDCLTFVEEVLAMSLAQAPEEVDALLMQLRYAERVDYADRNHLMEAQWLPNNAAKGYLRDVTRRYGGADVVRVTKTISRATWGSRSSAELQIPEDRQLTGTFPLDIIPLDRAVAHARAVPSGTILVVVRADLPLKATRVTHLGFVVQKRKRTYLRHAARSMYMRVVDEDLETFLLRNSKYEKWKVSGIALYEALPPPPRSAAR
jgi:hypothetical protein